MFVRIGLPSALAAATLACAVSAQAATVTFNAGTYSLAASNLGDPVDTLTITVTSGTAFFKLVGQDNETFSLPDVSAPDALPASSPAFNSPADANWDTTTSPWVTFYPTVFWGGLSIGPSPGGDVGDLVDLYQSTEGTGQVFTLSTVPEPADWAMMLAGLAGAGGALRLARRRNQTSPAAV